MSTNLYNRIANINIGGRVFTYPPFSVEFDQSFEIGRITTSTVKLYNPSPDTVKVSEAKKSGTTYTFPKITVNAGYVDSNGTCIVGEISKYKVTTSGPDRILELTVNDATETWANAIINKSWSNTKASVILKDILATVNVSSTAIELENDLTFKKLTVWTFRDGLQKITQATGSEYYFINGVLTIGKKTPKQKTVFNLTPQSGLISRPEKIQGGIKFKTLFFYQIGPGTVVKIVSAEYDKSFKVVRGKKRFSTFGDANCEFEAVEV